MLFTHPSVVKRFVEDSSRGKLTVLPINEYGKRFPYEFRNPYEEPVHSFYDVLYNRPNWQGQELVGKLNLPEKVHDFCAIGKCLEQTLRLYPAIMMVDMREYGVNGNSRTQIRTRSLDGHPFVGYFQGEVVPAFPSPKEQSPFNCF